MLKVAKVPGKHYFMCAPYVPATFPRTVETKLCLSLCFYITGIGNKKAPPKKRAGPWIGGEQVANLKILRGGASYSRTSRRDGARLQPARAASDLVFVLARF